MNACQDMQDRLIDYHKGELLPGEVQKVEAHLAECPACAAVLENVRGIFGKLREELVPVEMSAHFRAALHERIRAEAEAASVPAVGEESPVTLAPLRPPTMWHSERYLREMRKPLVQKIWAHARRSPYFAASVLLHGVAAVVLVALLVQLHTKPTPHPLPTAEAVDPGMGERIYEYVIEPEGQYAVYAAAYHQRTGRPHVLTRAVREGDWVHVDVSQFAGQATLVAVPDLYFGMIRMYFADGDGYPDSAGLMSRFSQGTLCRVERNVVGIPGAVADPVFGDGSAVRIFDMEDRLELWNEERWNHLESIVRMAQVHLRHGMTCLLAPLRGRNRDA